MDKILKDTITDIIYKFKGGNHTYLDPVKIQISKIDERGHYYSDDEDNKVEIADSTIPRYAYIFNTFQTLESKNKLDIGLNNKCVHRLRLSFGKDTTVDDIKIDKKERVLWYKFLETFIKKINNCDRYTIFLLSLKEKLEGHRNILVIEHLKDKINIVVYDPMGSDYSEFNVDKVIRTIGDELETITEKKVNIMKKEISCPIGLQKVSEDLIGYCVMFSYFWIYCVMHIISMIEKHYKNTPELTLWLDKVEIYIYDILKNSNSSIFNTVVNFTDYYTKKVNLYISRKEASQYDIFKILPKNIAEKYIDVDSKTLSYMKIMYKDLLTLKLGDINTSLEDRFERLKKAKQEILDSIIEQDMLDLRLEPEYIEIPDLLVVSSLDNLIYIDDNLEQVKNELKTVLKDEFKVEKIEDNLIWLIEEYLNVSNYSGEYIDKRIFDFVVSMDDSSIDYFGIDMDTLEGKN
jgi:hypothetical protein